MPETKIEIVLGDITLQEVDAIVNAANNHLWMGAGSAGAIVRAGGREIEDEAMSQGPIEIGEAIVTGGGDLPANHVIHAAAMGEDLMTSAEMIRAAMENALRRAEELNLQSVALPALGTGVGGFPLDRAAEIMLSVAREHSGTENSVPLVRFVLFDQDAYDAFKAVGQG